MLKRKEVLVLGDSHAIVFASKYIKFLMPWCRFKVVSVLGATVSGLENPNSKTKAANIYNEALKKNSAIKNVIFLLGEVDTGFVIWYRAQKYNASIDEMLMLALDNYKKLLMDDLLKEKNVIVMSAPLPTIKDDNNWGDVANVRKEIKAPIEERTKLTLEFNNLLSELTRQLNHRFISFDKLTLKKHYKGAKAYLRNTNRKDHHYNKLAYSFLIFFKLLYRLN